MGIVVTITLGIISAHVTTAPSGHWATLWASLSFGCFAAALTLLVLLGWAQKVAACRWSVFAGAFSAFIVSVRIESWLVYRGLGAILVALGLATIILSLGYAEQYARNRLVEWGPLVGFALMIAGEMLFVPALGPHPATSRNVAFGLIAAGVGLAALGRFGGPVYDIQVFGVATGILVAAAGAWLLLADTSPIGIHPQLIWWAYAAWFLVMSLVTLYIPNLKTDPSAVQRPE